MCLWYVVRRMAARWQDSLNSFPSLFSGWNRSNLENAQFHPPKLTFEPTWRQTESWLPPKKWKTDLFCRKSFGRVKVLTDNPPPFWIRFLITTISRNQFRSGDFQVSCLQSNLVIKGGRVRRLCCGKLRTSIFFFIHSNFLMWTFSSKRIQCNVIIWFYYMFYTSTTLRVQDSITT